MSFFWGGDKTFENCFSSSGVMNHKPSRGSKKGTIDNFICLQNFKHTNTNTICVENAMKKE